MKTANPRNPDHAIHDQFIDRWSPRSFDPSPLPADTIMSLFEAARWAPSCFNAQPWRFFYASSDSSREKFLDTLVPKNRLWAEKAPLLVYIVAEKNFSHNGKPNRFAAFDAGAAWISLAFQARHLGLYSHAMAGYNQEKAFELLKLNPDNHEILAAVAVGKQAGPLELHPDFQKMEKPNTRDPIADKVTEI